MIYLLYFDYNKKMNLKILLIVLLISFGFSSCSYFDVFKDKIDTTKMMNAKELYDEGTAFLEARDFPNAIKFFEILESRYPFGIYATQAMLDLAYANYAFNQNDEAIAECNRFIRLYPNHPNVDYAFYLRALANFQREQPFLADFLAQDVAKYDITKLQKSYEDFSIVTNRFPNSKYAEDSLNRLIFLRNKMAAHELYIAKYYNKRAAYVASIARIKHLLENYSGTPSTEESLTTLIDNYNNLQIYDLAYDSARVLKKNYPNYVISKKNNTGEIIISKLQTKNVTKTEPMSNEKESSYWSDFLSIFSW